MVVIIIAINIVVIIVFIIMIVIIDIICTSISKLNTNINIDTDIRLAMTGAVRKFLFENPDKFDAREWLKPAREAAKQVCKQRYLEFGCEGQGSKIKGLSLQTIAAQYASGALAQVVN